MKDDTLFLFLILFASIMFMSVTICLVVLGNWLYTFV